MEELYKKYSKLIYRYLYSLTKNEELSEELMQETFCGALKSINNFKGESKITVWLCQIAKNKWKNYLIKKSQINTVAFDENIEKILIEDNISNSIDEQNEKIQLYKEIHHLDEETREVFYLRIKGELSFKEIGEIIGKTEEWARVTFYRGKIKIKEELLSNEKRV